VFKQNKVAINEFLKRLHNFAVHLGWIAIPIIAPYLWPKYEPKDRRGITQDEHQSVLAKEKNAEWKLYLELLWETGAAQSDAASFTAEDIDWQTRTISYFRKKTGSLAQFTISKALETVLSHRQKVRLGLRFSTHVFQTPFKPACSNYPPVFQQPAMDAWDVRTNKNRWWVITNPTNLYSQRLFPSLDYTISFHVGVTTRMAQAEMTDEQEEAHDKINQLMNRLAGARATLFKAKKAEDFQSVGMKCRECLLLLVKTFVQTQMVPTGQEPPQLGNFIGWCELIANFFAPGGSNHQLRSYLKGMSKETWQLASWLAHPIERKQHGVFTHKRFRIVLVRE
jgi:hypothetical protein